MRSSWVHRARGFTLVEVLVAIVILGVVGVGIVGFFSTVVATARATDLEQSQTIDVKSFLEAVASAWAEDTAFEDGLLPDTPTVPDGCEAAPSVLDGDVRTLEVNCDAVDGPFVLALGRP